MPPNWIRSRIRRQHLIALGIPINLDEVMPHTNSKSMRTINVTTRPSSAPPGPRGQMSGPNSRAGTPRPSTPQPAQGIAQHAHDKLSNLATFGQKPVLDDAKITKMLKLDSGPVLNFLYSESSTNCCSRYISSFASFNAGRELEHIEVLNSRHLSSPDVSFTSP